MKFTSETLSRISIRSNLMSIWEITGPNLNNTCSRMQSKRPYLNGFSCARLSENKNSSQAKWNRIWRTKLASWRISCEHNSPPLRTTLRPCQAWNWWIGCRLTSELQSLGPLPTSWAAGPTTSSIHSFAVYFRQWRSCVGMTGANQVGTTIWLTFATTVVLLSAFMSLFARKIKTSTTSDSTLLMEYWPYQQLPLTMHSFSTKFSS